MASEDAVRTRILSHMNKDHVYDSKLYLIHHLSYPKTLLLPSSTTKVSLSDIQTTHLSVSIDGQVKEIPFNPAMNSLSDSRVRLVEMTRAAEASLGVNRDTVDIKVEYLPPRGPVQIGVTLLMVVVLYILLLPSTLQPGGFLYEKALKNVPEVAGLMLKAVPFGFWTFVSIHIAEALWFVWFKLAKFATVPGVDAVTAALWIGDVLLQGFGALHRWNVMVERQIRKKRGKKDH